MNYERLDLLGNVYVGSHNGAASLLSWRHACLVRLKFGWTFLKSSILVFQSMGRVIIGSRLVLLEVIWTGDIVSCSKRIIGRLRIIWDFLKTLGWCSTQLVESLLVHGSVLLEVIWTGVQVNCLSSVKYWIGCRYSAVSELSW